MIIKATLVPEAAINRLICETFPLPGDVIMVEDRGEAIVQKVIPMMINVIWADESEPSTYKLSVERKI